jgi:putative selenate reductase FAD-binding subunit
MLNKYYRPDNLEEALKLLSKPEAMPLAGGTFINSPGFPLPQKTSGAESSIAYVDLQSLGLDHIRKHGNSLEIEATVTLQQLLENSYASDAIREAIKLEAPLNIRNMATVAGALVSSDGRSPFTTAMLALDAKLSMLPGEDEIRLGEFLLFREKSLPGKLITKITVPLNAQLFFESVSRSPADRPIVCVAIARWSSGRVRLALGGYGDFPLLAMDGTTDDDIQAAARNGYHEAGDEWASAEYRSETAAILSGRCI